MTNNKQELQGAYFVTLLMLVAALVLSGVAAWFSVVGLIAVFAASPLSIAVMAGTLEVSKLICASWVYNYWAIAPRLIKAYLTTAVVVLMFITSMGIFGYLSKAHLDQGVPTGEVAAKVQLIDERIRIQEDAIKVQRDNIAASRAALSQLDAQVGASLDRSTTAAGADRSVSIRRQQTNERRLLQTEISKAQSEIEKLNVVVSQLREEKAPIAAELRKVEAEVGPIKYIAALIYGDNPDSNLLERAVRWVTILLVIVFDPLAVIMLIAANYGMRYHRNLKQSPEEVAPAVAVVDPVAPAAEEEATPEIDQWNKMLEAAEAEALKEHEESKKNSKVEDPEVFPDPLPVYPSTEEDLEELISATSAAVPQAPIQPESAKTPYSFQELGADYVNLNGKTFSKPVYEGLKARGELEQELSNSVVSITPIEGISLERVKDLINKIEQGTVSIDDLTLPEREAIKKYLESNA